MATTDQLPLSSTVSFELYPAAVLGASFNNVKILGLIDAYTARELGRDIDALHRNVYPMLPVGTPDDPTAYMYVRVELQGGQREIFGLPWIKGDSIVAASYNTIVATISGVGPDDYNRVIEALSSNGFNSIKIETKNA